MKNSLLVFGITGALALVACSGDDSATSSIPDAAAGDSTSGTDASQSDTGTTDSSSDTSTADSASDAAADSATNDGATADAGDAGLLPLNGCNTADFADHTGAADLRAITGPATALPAQWQPPCMKIKVGQSVTWTTIGTFVSHPLEPKGGDSGNPITTTNTGTTKSFAFPTAGVYGFDCANHPLSMLGAIMVVP